VKVAGLDRIGMVVHSATARTDLDAERLEAEVDALIAQLHGRPDG